MEKLIKRLYFIIMNNKYYLTKKLKNSLNALQEKIIKRGDLPYVSVNKQLIYVNELLQFPLGKFLIENREINTFWTDYIIQNNNNQKSSNLENFILNHSPFILAWRELSQIFHNLIQKNLKNKMTLASIPCGAMRELLCLDYSYISHISLIGVDINSESLLLAKNLAKTKGLITNLKLFKQDAGNLPFISEIDLITSCGLNIYETDQQKVLNLYRQFYKALKTNGKLVIGFLTYPPGENKNSEWDMNKISSNSFILEKIIFKDILDLKFRNFRTSKEFEKELKTAGFSEVIFHYDRLKIFPTVIAKKK